MECVLMFKKLRYGKVTPLSIQMNQHTFLLIIFTLINIELSFIFVGIIIRAIQGENKDFVRYKCEVHSLGLFILFFDDKLWSLFKYTEIHLVFPPILISLFIYIGVQNLSLYIFLDVLIFMEGYFLKQSSIIFCLILYFIILKTYPESYFFMLFITIIFRKLWTYSQN